MKANPIPPKSAWSSPLDAQVVGQLPQTMKRVTDGERTILSQKELPWGQKKMDTFTLLIINPAHPFIGGVVLGTPALLQPSQGDMIRAGPLPSPRTVF